MLRKDREVTDLNEIYDILCRCSTLRLGLFDEEYPYVVPVSFGAELKGRDVIVYFHGARRGTKLALIAKNPHIAAEADIYYKTELEHAPNGITVRYESVMGRGIAEEVTDEAEKIHGLQLMEHHYGYTTDTVAHCGRLKHTVVYKITLHEITGKRNLPTETGYVH